MQQVSRIQNRPMKSPSPDVAGKNKIRDTKLPIDDVKRYIDKNSHTKSPRPTKISFHSNENQYDIEQLLRKIRQLEAANGRLLDDNAQLRQKLINSNNSLHGSLDAMREVRSQHPSGDASPKSGSDLSEQLKLMQDRLMKLASENSRIINLLQEKEKKEKLMQAENENLRQSLACCRNNPMNMGASQSRPDSVIQDYYESTISPKMRQSQIEWQHKLRELSDRLARIKSLQDEIESKFLTRSLINTPVRQANIKNDFSTARKTEEPQRSGRYNNMFNSHTQPFDYSEKCPRCPILEDRIKQLDEEVRKNQDRELARSSSSRSAKIKASSDNFLKNKIRELEEEIEHRIIENSNLQRDIANLRDEIGRKKEKYEREIEMLKNERDSYKKAFEQEKQISSQQDQYIDELRNKIKDLEEELAAQGKDQKTNSLQSHKDELKKLYENKEKGLKEYYEQLLEAKNKEISDHLQNYLELLNSIKKDIQESDFEGLVSENETIMNDKMDVEKQIGLIQEENKRIINELRLELTKKEHQILELEKSNHLMAAEIAELQGQKEKLKNLMLEMEAFKPVMQVTDDMRKSTQRSMTRYRSENGCRLKTCLKDTIKKIDSLQNQITEMLRDDENIE